MQPTIITTEKARDWTDREGQRVRKVIIHATVGTNSLGWLKGNPKGTSIHVLITKEGVCYQMLEDEKGANHVGYSRLVVDGMIYSQYTQYNCNHVTVGLELENLNDGKDPYPDVQLQAAAWWVQKWMNDHHLTRDDVLMHRDIDQHGKTDAAGITLSDIFRYLDEPPPPDPAITADLPIVGLTHGSSSQAGAYLDKRGSDASYTNADHHLIAGYYWSLGQQVGVDPLMAFAQMVHETGGLTSWWSLRPRRNPAGLGVTGEMKRQRTSPGIEWQYDTKSRLWKKGHAFPDWTFSVKAHLGHLIAYAVKPGLQTDAQTNIVRYDPRAPALPASYRGIAQSWIDLNGRWAYPGTTYAQSIAKIAQAILTT